MTHSNLSQLFDSLIPYIEKQLIQHASFYPYAAFLDNTNKITMIATWPETEYPKSQDLIDEYNKILIQEAHQRNIIAGVIAYDVKLTKKVEKKDVIQFKLEHVNGESINVFLPYRIEDGKVIFEEAWKEKKEPEWFV